MFKIEYLGEILTACYRPKQIVENLLSKADRHFSCYSYAMFFISGCTWQKATTQASRMPDRYKGVVCANQIEHVARFGVIKKSIIRRATRLVAG